MADTINRGTSHRPLEEADVGCINTVANVIGYLQWLTRLSIVGDMVSRNKQGVVYLLTAMQSAARLIVSLYSLRRWYSGQVTVFTTRTESHQIGELCRRDKRLRVCHTRCSEQKGKRLLAAYLTKTTIPQSAPYEKNLFLDADTLIDGPIDELFKANSESELVVTGFMGGASNRDPVKARLQCWRAIQTRINQTYELKSRLTSLMSTPYPAVNAGVFAFQRNARFTARWHTLARLGRKLPLPDEISLQIILFESDHIFLGHQYNCHPYSFHRAVGASIWHFAGHTHLAPYCRDLWLPVYIECVTRSIAKLERWSSISEIEPLHA